MNAHNPPSSVVLPQFSTISSSTEQVGRLHLKLFIGLLSFAFFLAFCAGRLKFSNNEFVGAAAFIVVMCGGSGFYRHIRPDQRIERMFRSAVELFLLSVLTGSLSYAAATFNYPLTDQLLHSWDLAIGFDWRACLDLLNEHPHANTALVFAYDSMQPQLVVVVILLALTRLNKVLDTFLLAFGVSAAVAVFVSGLMPAMSPLIYYGILPSDHPSITLAVPMEFAQHTTALRDGSLRLFQMSGAQGLVTFPSFHSCCAVLLALAFWQVPYARWGGLMLNGLMLVSVPVEGSHYLVDVLAGVVLAFSSWWAVDHILSRHQRSSLNPSATFT